MRPKSTVLFRRAIWATALVASAVALAFLLQSLTRRGGISAAVLRRSVYRIRIYSQPPDFASPWKGGAAATYFGTGFHIGDGRILTNAHVIEAARFITVQRSDGRTVPATPAFVADDADLAILKVAEPHFFDSAPALALGELPKLRSPVYTVGFPLGGEKISITAGVVSRVDYRLYVHTGHHRHLLVQVDSAINPGNSGGPVVQGEKVVGVAFEVNQSAQGTGYIVPTPVIRRFLGDIADGHYDGHPEDGLAVQTNALFNPAAAQYLGVQGAPSGVLVTRVATWSPFHGHVREGDVLLAIDGHRIDPDGRALYEDERVDFKVYYDLRQIGETVKLSVLRDGQTATVEVTAAKPSAAHYSPARIFPERPEYLVYGGLVFEALSRNYLETWGDDWNERAPEEIRYLHRFLDREPDFANAAAPVVMATRLPHAVNAYVDVPPGSVLAKVNGTPIGSLADLRRTLAAAQGEYVVLEFWGGGPVVVLARAAALAANPAIAKTYRIGEGAEAVR